MTAAGTVAHVVRFLTESRTYVARVASADAREGIVSIRERGDAVFPPLSQHPSERF